MDKKVPKPPRKLRTRKLSSYKPKKKNWRWKNKIPRRAVTIVSGDGDVGKSTLMTTIAAHVTLGTDFPDGEICEKGRVLLLTNEELPDEDVLPRLMGAGGDPDLYEIVVDTCEDDESNSALVTVLNKYNLVYLDAWLADHSDTKLVIIDTITDYLDEKTNENSEKQIKKYMENLTLVAQRHDIAIVALAHFNKKIDAPAAYRLSGSAAFRHKARASWQVYKDPNDRSKSSVLFDKGNKIGTGIGFSFSFHTYQYMTDEGPDTTSFAVISSEPLTMDAQTYSRQAHIQRDSPQADAASDWLFALLSVESPIPSAEIIERAQKEGHPQATVYRPKPHPQLKPVNKVVDEKRISLWSLPKETSNET